MCKNVSKQTQHAHCDSSDNPALLGGHMHDLDHTVSMLGLCDHSNLLFVLSAEERRVLLKLLWGLVLIFTVVEFCCSVSEVNVIGRSPDSAYSTPARDNSTEEKSTAGVYCIGCFVVDRIYFNYFNKFYDRFIETLKLDFLVFFLRTANCCYCEKNRTSNFRYKDLIEEVCIYMWRIRWLIVK